MKSLYSKYIWEKEGLYCYEEDYGFVTYSFNKETCYVSHLYIVPEKRHEGLASKMLDEIVEDAKSQGCKILKGSVNMSGKDSTESLAFHLKYGMKLEKSTPFAVVTYKEI